MTSKRTEQEHQYSDCDWTSSEFDSDPQCPGEDSADSYSDTELNTRLELLCLSVTEQALG